MKKKSMLIQVVIAIVLAIIIGKLTGTTGGIFGITFYELFGLGGKLFLNALTLIVVPLIASSIISGLGQLGKEKSFGKLGLRTFAFHVGTTLIAVIVGVLIVNLIRPGLSYQIPQAVSPSVAETTKPVINAGPIARKWRKGLMPFAFKRRGRAIKQ